MSSRIVISRVARPANLRCFHCRIKTFASHHVRTAVITFVLCVRIVYLVVVAISQKKVGVVIALHNQVISLGSFIICRHLFDHELHLDEVLSELVEFIVFTHDELFVCEYVELETIRCLFRLIELLLPLLSLLAL